MRVVILIIFPEVVLSAYLFGIISSLATDAEKVGELGPPEIALPSIGSWLLAKNEQVPPWAEIVSFYMRRMAIQEFKQDRRAPDFILPNFVGGEVRLSDFRGNLVLLNFWATWCGPCRVEMPSMEKLYQEFRDRNFMILAISIDRDGPETILDFVNSFYLSFPILLDPEGRVSSMYGVTSIPTTYLIDPQGRLIGVARGPRDWDSNSTRNLIRILLESSGRF